MLWFTEQAGNRIGRLDPATGRIVEYDVPTPRANTYGIIGSRREMAVYFAELEGHKLGRVDVRTGKGTELPTPTPNSGVRRLALDPSGGSWMSCNRAGKTGPFAPRTTAVQRYDAPRGPHCHLHTTHVDSSR